MTNPVESSADLETLLTQADWEDLTARLLLYTIHLLERYDLPKEKADDYVIRGVTSVLERRHTPEKSMPLFGVLARTIALLVRSDIECADRTA